MMLLLLNLPIQCHHRRKVGNLEIMGKTDEELPCSESWGYYVYVYNRIYIIIYT
jgi:hypothetical protein